MPTRSKPGRTQSAGGARTPAQSLQEYGRGIAGGLLFSLPLLYTMEVWQAGFTMPPSRQLAYVLLTMLLLLGYNRYAGLHPDVHWSEVAIDSIEELGLGLLLAALVLLLAGRFAAEQHLGEILGRIVVEGMTVAIGVSVGTAQLGQNADEGSPAERRKVTFAGQLTMALCGAVLFAANIAPTEEVVVIGVGAPPGQVLGLAGLSLAIGALILFFSDFRGSGRWARRDGLLAVFRGLVITYAVSLVASAAILWLFGRFEGMGLAAVVGMTVVLGLAAALGASAGRLLLQPDAA